MIGPKSSHVHILRTRHLTLAPEVYYFLSLSRAKVVHRWFPMYAGSAGHIFPGDSSGYVSHLPSFSSHRHGGVTKIRLLWYCTTLGLTLYYYNASALSVLLLHLLAHVAPSSPYLGKCLERCFPVHQRVWSWADHSGTAWDTDSAPWGCLPCICFSPELVPVFQPWVWKLVWTIHIFLLGEQEKTLPWRWWSVFECLSSWCWHLQLFLLPYSLLLQPPCAWGRWEIPHPLCLQKLISGVVTFSMHKQC